MRVKEYDWLSIQSVIEIQKEPNCIFAGISGAMPEEIKKNLETVPTKTYCIIYDEA